MKYLPTSVLLALDALRRKMENCCSGQVLQPVALGATIVSSSISVVSNSNQGNHIYSELFSQPNGGLLLAVLLGGIGLWAILQLIVGGAVRTGICSF